MSAKIETLYGLRGANLEAFKRAGDIIEANMRRVDPETYLRAMRQQLEHARLAFPRQLDDETHNAIVRADAHGDIAANLLAIAIKVQS